MKAVADTLGVARSNLVEAARGQRRPRQPYRKAGDAELLAALRRLVDERPTYGYRRLAALLNRERRARGEPAVNGKRVLRVLRAAGLTLQAHTARRPGRTHDGAVVALRSNVRWCSDHCEIAGRDGSIVRLLFAIDACDREILGWHATTAGISGEMVRDLMVACVERRFGATRTTHAGRMAVRQRLGLPGQGHARHGHRPWPAARLHPGPLARKQRHRRGVREDPQARLCQGHPAPGCPDHSRARRRLDRGLQHQPPALRSADALAPRVPRPLCLTQPVPCPVKRGALHTHLN